MQRKGNKYILACAFTIIMIAWGCGSKPNTEEGDINRRISLAAQLSSKGLYEEAAKEYMAALSQKGLSDKKRSNICYILANLYFEEMKDYEKALANYIRAKHYDPQSQVMQKITERTVTCLERIGRSLDARNVLSDATYLAGEETRQFPGKVVAQIADREITMGELENEIQKLPEEMQKRFRNNNEEKLEFLRQYIQKELLWQMAKRSGFDKDPEIRRQAEDFEKMLLVQMVYNTHVNEKINITPEEARLYFKAHKQEFMKNETKSDTRLSTQTAQTTLSDEELFHKNAQRIMRELQGEKALKYESQLLENLMKSQNVIIFEGEFK